MDFCQRKKWIKKNAFHIIDTEDSEAFADTIPINENNVKSDNKNVVQQSLTTNAEDSEDDIRRRKVRKRNGRRVANPFIADDDVTTTTNSECMYRHSYGVFSK